jgi:hypothetical protein
MPLKIPQRKIHYPKKLRFYLFLCSVATVILSIIGLCFWIQNSGNRNSQCKTPQDLNLMPNQSQTIPIQSTSCYGFNADVGQKLVLNTSIQSTLIQPNNRPLRLQGFLEQELSQTGSYILVISPPKSKQDQEFTIELQDQGEINSVLSPPILPSTSVASSNSSKFSYNLKSPPPFKTDQKLQQIVDEILALIQAKGLSTHNLSISLVNLSYPNNCCDYASYSDNQPIFPASVSKLFWLVALYGQYDAGILPEGTISEQDVYKMIQDSDNKPASRVVDVITGTESGGELNSEELKIWMDKRLSVNGFFKNAGYRNLDVSQKNFPIPYLNLDRPDKGRDLQIRGKGTLPIRNHLTSYDIARLLYEIDNNQAISKEYSLKIKDLLKRDLNPQVWKQKQYNSIEGFFAESLPQDSHVFSKVGWTFESRQDAAIIESPDRRTRYILVILADNPSFGDDWKVFPEISKRVYDRMIENQ